MAVETTVQVVMPQMGDSVTEGTILEWHKQEGDTVEADEGRRIFLNAYCEVRPEYKGTRFSIYEALSLATRALVVIWARPTNWQYTAETLIALAYERLKTRWGE